MSDPAHSIDWEFFGPPADGGVRPGDLISAAAGGLPIYRVMSLDHGRAWLRDIESGADRVTPLTPFHWKAGSQGS